MANNKHDRQTNPVIHQQMPQAYLENMATKPYKQPGTMGPYKLASSTTTDQEKEMDLDRGIPLGKMRAILPGKLSDGTPKASGKEGDPKPPGVEV